MSRIVLKGLPGALYTLQASDLPPDLNLKFSHWEYVDFSGFNLSAYDMREVDFVGCKGDGSTLPFQLDGLYSRGTSFLNAVIPAALPPGHMHDIVVELLRQRILALPNGVNRTFAQALRDYFFLPNPAVVDYAVSFSDIIHYLRTTRGFTAAQCRTRGAVVFAPYPRWRTRITWMLNDPSSIRPRPIYDDGGQVRVLAPNGEVFVDFRADFPGDIDRALVSFRIAQRLSALTGKAFRVHVTQIDPFPLIEAVAVELMPTVGNAFWWRAFSGGVND